MLPEGVAVSWLHGRMHPQARDVDLEVELELVYELEVDRLDSEPVHARPYDPDLLVHLDIELVDDELDHPWFAEDGAALAGGVGDDVYEIDPIHPLRRLGAWVRGGLRARA